MQEKMNRFLRSIGIEESEDFDLDFVLVGRNPYQKERVDMVVSKVIPWEYSLLDRFISASGNIHYPYSLRFTYLNMPEANDVVSLLADWYLARFSTLPPCGIEEEGEEKLSFIYADEESLEAGKDWEKDFLSLMKFINYPFEFSSKVKPFKAEEEPQEEPPMGLEEMPEEIGDIPAGESEPLIEGEAEEETPKMALEEMPEEPAENEETSSLPEAPFNEEEAPKTVLADMPEESSEILSDGLIPEEDFTLEEETPKMVLEEMPEDNGEPLSGEFLPEEEKGEEDELLEGVEDLKPSSEEALHVEEAKQDSIDLPVDGAQAIAKDEAKFKAEAEESLLDEAERNLAIMLEERARKRVWERGDYKIINQIDDIYALEVGNVDFFGEVFSNDIRNSSKGKAILTLGVGDMSNAINVRAFETKNLPKAALEKFVKKSFVRVRGAIDKDRYTGQKVIIAHYLDPIASPKKREDPEEVKRVELHLHTNMSVMDAVPDFKSYYDVAKGMGMDAIAITDHGVVQNFPAAQACHDEDRKAFKSGKSQREPLKIIYGAELYMFDLEQNYIQNPCDQKLTEARYCVFDTETTGLSARYDRLVEFGGVIVERGRVIRRFDTLINPEIDLEYAAEALAINKLSAEELRKAPTFREVLPKIREFMGDLILVAHNASFDIGFINAALQREGLAPLTNPVIDTIPISHYLFPEAGRHTEGAFLRNLGLNVYDEKDAHRADYDSEKLNDGWQEAIIRLNHEFPGITHRDLQHLMVARGDKEKDDPETFDKKEAKFNAFCRHLREYHACVLVKNQEGLSDLNRIISEGHTTYFEGRFPKTPRSLLQTYRKNFLIGTACFNGEIFEMALTRDLSTLVEAMQFYDYVEIQPIENYSYLLNMGRVQSKEHLIEVLKDIIEAARQAGKPVVATGDCHYVNPEDKILRDVYINAKAKGGGAHPMNPPSRARKPHFENPDQHFRSTREMLDSFEAWLDKDLAYEIVVTNTRYISSLIDNDITPVSDDLFAPNRNLPNSEEKIRDLCYGNFEKNYAYTFDDDPVVHENIAKLKGRLDRELEGIIGNGYAVTYYIAYRLIKLANEEPEHFIVGSRGSVGSSFAATMAEITEVNPLPPHYHCPHCHYFEFGDAEKYKSGFDLPDKTCPKCGHKLDTNGQNIPFETFLGFHADKVPDIDLNFEDESQHRAHNYTKDLLGEKNVFRAGTIEKVAEKTAFGYVRGYFESIGKNPDEMNTNYIAYIAAKCEGVKRTTGQHPGGIVVIPAEHSVYDFTAVQHPADDLESEWLTTHYDFRSMHDEVLKLDILGHVDPMAMRFYRDLTGVRIEDIPMNDERVLSLFLSPKELNLQRDFLHPATGAAALPEFGTATCQRMLDVARPHCFNDLLIISGLAHGTDVWAGNAEDLVKSGKSLNEVIGCRDDIMTYLISMGLDPSMSFKIMEDVRKGRGLKPENEEAMLAHKVPQFYIDACKKIKYLFPRGHATAYVMMAVRVAYFKLYYPLEFYAVFFSIRSDAWDIKAMIAGEDAVIGRIRELSARAGSRDNPLSNKEAAMLDSLQVAIEMLERGYHFENFDLYRSDAKMFVVDHEKKSLIPPFNVIDGLGLSAANSIIEAREEKDSEGNKKPFLSKEDLLSRASKLNSSNLKKLEEFGVLDGLGETNQMSLFEFL